MKSCRRRSTTVMVLGLVATIAGCGDPNAPGTDGGADGGAENDLTVIPSGDAAGADLGVIEDASTPPPDLTVDGTVPIVDLAGDAAGTLPTLSISDVSITEGNSGTTGITFNVVLSQASAQTVTVNYATVDGTATRSANDYSAVNGRLTFSPGTTTLPITVLVTGDTLNEANETFTVTLASPVNATLAQTAATATINNDDPLPTLTIANASGPEGNSGPRDLFFIATLSAASGQTITFNYATADGTATTADGDYLPRDTTVTISPGRTAQGFIVQLGGDITVEPDETFTINLSNPTNAILLTTSAVGTITNDDVPGPGVSIADAAIDEGNSGTKALTFTVTLAAANTQTVTVQYSTQGFAARSDAAAPGGADFVATNGTLTFPPGVTTQTFDVTINGDTVFEDNENFYVNLSNATNANITRAQGSGVINNDGDAPPTISVNDISVNEGDSARTNFVFTVSLSAVSGVYLSVQYSAVNGTANSSDFFGGGGNLNFLPGTVTQTITVQVIGDTTNEPDETFTVNLTSATSGTIGKGTGIGTIINDDPLPVLSITDVALTEGNSGNKAFTFNVQLSIPSGRQVTVNYATADGTATAANFDYTAASGTLTFAPGATSRSFVVPVVGDATTEPDETFTVNLSGEANATLARTSATGTIVNDD